MPIFRRSSLNTTNWLPSSEWQPNVFQVLLGGELASPQACFGVLRPTWTASRIWSQLAEKAIGDFGQLRPKICCAYY